MAGFGYGGFWLWQTKFGLVSFWASEQSPKGQLSGFLVPWDVG